MTAHIAIQATGSKIGGKLLNVFTLEHETVESAAKHFRDSGYRVEVREPGHIVHVWDTAKARAMNRSARAAAPGAHWTSAHAWMDTAQGRWRRISQASRSRIARATARGDPDRRIAAGQHGSRLVDCPSCLGFGKALGAGNMLVPCAACGGRGKVPGGNSRRRYHSHPAHPSSHPISTKHRRSR